MKQALSGTGRLLLTLRTNTPKKDVVTGKLKSVSIADLLFQSGNIFHIHIKNPTAFLASYMTMLLTPMIETIRSARNLHSADDPHIRQQLQVPVYRRFADIRMLFRNFVIDLVCRGMALQFVYRIQNQRALNCVSLFHNSHQFTENPYLMILYINKYKLSIVFFENYSESGVLRICRNRAYFPPPP